ncbi:MAG: rRNA maturation RNase YbeY [Candidatus Uhrbacteria bacterium]
MIQFELLTRRPLALPERDLEKIAVALSKKLGLKGVLSVSVSFVSETAMKRLNRDHMGKNRPTDVLAFPMEHLFVPPKEARPLGDIVVCAKYAEREAKRRLISTHEELVRLLIHGTLHLLGYDHDTDFKETRMFGLQEQVLGLVYNV